MTIPTIVGSEVELDDDDDDDPAVADDCITRRIKSHQLNSQVVCMKIHGVILILLYINQDNILLHYDVINYLTY